MSRIVVTDGLADTLKMLRTQNKIKSKTLAEHIGKTPGYITKLEKKEIKHIDMGVLEQIFEFILGDDYKATAVWEGVYASLQIKHSNKDIEDELWFTNYDTVYRYIPVPESLIDYINAKMEELNITRSRLLERINANESLTEAEIKDENIRANVWYPSLNGEGASIKIVLEKDLFDRILDKQEPSVCYVFVLSIVYYILKIEQYGELVDIGEEQGRLFNKSTDVLNEHKFYSIVERDRVISGAKSKEELSSLLSGFDRENLKLLEEIIAAFSYASEKDIRVTNSRLTSFLKNLKEDLWFTLRIISLNFDAMSSLDITQKKAFLQDLDLLIEKYIEEQKKLKKTETY